MRVCDYIIKHLMDVGVKYIFLVVGGGAMYLNDAIKKSRIKYVCFHHEQAAAIAAEGYARVNQELAVVCVTSGPGGLNCLTGVMGQWTDSVPILYLSGQVNQLIDKPKDLRQLGDQEVDIISIVKPITKYSALVKDGENIGQILDKAIKEATQGRPGPVWLDIPLGVQNALC